MNIADEILEQAGKEMAREIDREVLWGMLQGMGWTRVTISSESSMVYATKIQEWLDVNCIEPYEKHRSDFIFENDKDAAFFILKWA